MSDPHAAHLQAQLLSGEPAIDPVAVAERLLAVQGQDPRAFRLAVRARSRGLTAADVDRALTEDRSLVVNWLNRGTLHLVRSEDHAWLHALTTPPLLTGNARRLAQEGVTPDEAERGVEVVERALAEQGPLPRATLKAHLDRAGVRTERQALVHLLALAALRGLIARGPMVGGQHAYVLLRDWLAPAGPVDRNVALAELARRYLAGHGPANDRDLARWAGLPLRDARAGLSAIAGELDQREDGRVDLAGRPPPADPPPPRLLGGFEPVLLGWVDREPLIGPHRDQVTVGGIFRSFVLVGGRAVGTWRLEAGALELSPLEPVSSEDAAALRDDGADVMRFLALA